MIAAKVMSEKELQKKLADKGFTKTTHKTDTGVFWRDGTAGKHILVPHSEQGFYPNWMLEDIEEHIGKLSIWT
ncbi:MAG TPA: hypothetical protein VM074_01805 [Solimonas sp.]|nr:hypothetical protein [Solimonas sp.]